MAPSDTFSSQRQPFPRDAPDLLSSCVLGGASLAHQAPSASPGRDRPLLSPPWVLSLGPSLYRISSPVYPKAFLSFVLALYSPLVEVDLSLLAHHVGEAATNTLDGGHSEWDLVAPIDVGVKNTQNMLELILGKDESHATRGKEAD